MKNLVTKIMNQLPITLASSLIFALVMLLLDYVLQVSRGFGEQVFTFGFYFVFWMIIDLISNVPNWQGFWKRVFGRGGK